MDQENHIYNLINKFINNECTPEELKQVKAIILSGNYHHIWEDLIQKDALHRIIEDEELSSVEYSSHKRNIYERLSHNIDIKDVKNKVYQRRKRKVILSIAAVISLLVIAYWASIHSNQPSDNNVTPIIVTTKPGMKSKITLPDHSIVHLNAGSKLEYFEDFNKTSRKIRIDGEAYFEISENKAKPFIINSGNHQVVVLGTAFNFNNYQTNNTLKLTVTEGVVKLSFPTISNEHKDTLIYADQHLTFNRKSKVVKMLPYDQDKHMAWLENIITFDNTLLSEAIKQLELWYGVQIEVENDNINNCSISGRFEGESLEFILGAITMVSDIKYELNDKSVKLKGKGCL